MPPANRRWTPEQHAAHAATMIAKRLARAEGREYVSPSAQARRDAAMRTVQRSLRYGDEDQTPAGRQRAYRDRLTRSAIEEQLGVTVPKDGETFSAVQELTRVNHRLKNKVRAVERRNQTLTSRLDRLTQRVSAMESLLSAQRKAKTRRKADKLAEIA